MTRWPRIVAALPLLAMLACASLLGVRPPQERPFPHRAHVTKGVACVQCHSEITRDNGQGPAALPEPSACITCHSPPHDPGPCMDCHGQPEGRSSLSAAREHLRFSHAKHAGVALGTCMRCHGEVAESDLRMRPTMATCFSCHGHENEFNTGDCARCHRDMAGEQTRPESHLVHGQDFLQQHGMAAAASRDLCESCHAESSCAQCHGVTTAALPNLLRFDRVTNAQLHRGGFLARHAVEARAEPGLCMTCHSESSCNACHAQRGLIQRADLRRAPHPQGWVGPKGARNDHGPEARRDPMACASCHGGAGEALCVGCHRSGGVGGNPHPEGFSSGKRMSEMPCRSCHGGGP